MPIGFTLVAGWYLAPGAPGCVPMLPGGMIPLGAAKFVMIVAGWVIFSGTPPL